MDPELLRRLRELERETGSRPVQNEEEILEAGGRGSYPTERRSSDNTDRIIVDIQDVLKDPEGQS